ncbi:permease-like cell division protein FtsX [Elongatibacter sediminis]|uniref:Cell division protein FtsX n=1 Tax=Elongatibacter sediminis TaxID=3119006 RepID=A0AAW9REX7_9GAMM
MKRPGIRLRFRAWLRRQLYSFFSSLGTLLSHRVGTLMTVVVLGIAMALPLGLYVALTNLNAVDLKQDSWGTITVFLQSGTSAADARELTARIDARQDANATAISPEAGMEDFRDASGFGPALDMLSPNPLPWVIEVRPQPDRTDRLTLVVEDLTGWLQSQEAIDSVVVDTKWLQRLAGLLAVGNALVTVLAALFSVAVLVVVANTIRLDVANRADEIEVLSLVGAGNGFIRLPFLYSGFWYGLLGALGALLLLRVCLAFIDGPLSGLLDAYGNRFELSGVGFVPSLAVLATGGLLGLGGAWIAVARYLRALRRDGLLGRI